MNLTEYQDFVEKMSTVRVNELGLIYPALGLAGETGEVVEKIKKIVRDKGGKFDRDDAEYLRLELGDVMWYVAKLCNVLEIGLEETLIANVLKLEDRKLNGKK